MTIIEINKKLWPFPEKWDELSPGQCIAVMQVLCCGYNTAQARLQFIRILSGCGWWHYIRQSSRRGGMQKIEEQLYLCDFLFAHPQRTINPLPVYDYLIGPDDDFNNLLMGEFAYAQDYYEKYQENSQDMEALNSLCATLYRPAMRMETKYGAAGAFIPDDFRQPFTEAGMKFRKKQVAKWPFHIRELIFFWYSGCLKKLTADNADVFSGGDGEPALHGIVSIMRNVAKEGTYGDFNKVEQLYVKMLMVELRESKAEAAKMDKQ